MCFIKSCGNNIVFHIIDYILSTYLFFLKKEEERDGLKTYWPRYAGLPHRHKPELWCNKSGHNGHSNLGI